MHGPSGDLEHGWPPLALRIIVGETALRHVREHDLPHLTAILPDDYEHDPGPEPFAGHDLAAHRRRLLHQGHWRSLGTWSPASWCLDLVVEHRGEPVGVQSLEAHDFLTLRTVDSGSWLATHARGRGTGVAMRRAVLALAFDHLGARAAVSSARSDNAASLAVSPARLHRQRRQPQRRTRRPCRAAAPAADARDLAGVGAGTRRGGRGGRDLPGVVRARGLTQRPMASADNRS